MNFLNNQALVVSSSRITDLQMSSYTTSTQRITDFFALSAHSRITTLPRITGFYPLIAIRARGRVYTD